MAAASQSDRPMPKVVVFGTSLDPESRSQVLAREVERRLTAAGATAELIDLRALALPPAGPPDSWRHPDVQRVEAALADAGYVVFAVAVYNYDVSAAAKNLVELVGSSLQERVVGFACVAGGRNSYMAVMSFANSLMLDFRCWIVPRFVYALRGQVTETGVSDDVGTRLDRFIGELLGGPAAYRSEGSDAGGTS